MKVMMIKFAAAALALTLLPACADTRVGCAVTEAELKAEGEKLASELAGATNAILTAATAYADAATNATLTAATAYEDAREISTRATVSEEIAYRIAEIPPPDFSTNNTALVQTIKAETPDALPARKGNGGNYYVDNPTHFEGTTAFTSEYIYFNNGFYFGGGEGRNFNKYGVVVDQDKLIRWPTRAGMFALTNDIPVIPAWAMAETKPTYTAAEVGAWPAQPYSSWNVSANGLVLTMDGSTPQNYGFGYADTPIHVMRRRDLDAATNATLTAATAYAAALIADIDIRPLDGRTYDFATMQGVMDALKATIEALGGAVTNAPPATTQGE